MWSDLQAKTNGELLANLGNFVNRALKFLADRLGSTVPEAKGAAANEAILALGKEVQENVREYVSKLEKVSLEIDSCAFGNSFSAEVEPGLLTAKNVRSQKAFDTSGSGGVSVHLDKNFFSCEGETGLLFPGISNTFQIAYFL